jgi:hypothetical protein
MIHTFSPRCLHMPEVLFGPLHSVPLSDEGHWSARSVAAGDILLAVTGAGVVTVITVRAASRLFL